MITLTGNLTDTSNTLADIADEGGAVGSPRLPPRRRRSRSVVDRRRADNAGRRRHHTGSSRLA